MAASRISSWSLDANRRRGRPRLRTVEPPDSQVITGDREVQGMSRGGVREPPIQVRSCPSGSCLLKSLEVLAASDFSFAAASDPLWELAAVRVETKQVERAAEALGREVADDERDVAENRPQPRADHVPGAGRHRRAGASNRGRRPPRQAAGRFGQDPRGQAGHPVDGRRARQGGPARARPAVDDGRMPWRNPYPAHREMFIVPPARLRGRSDDPPIGPGHGDRHGLARPGCRSRTDLPWRHPRRRE